MKQFLFLAAFLAATGLMAQATIDFTGFNGSGQEASGSADVVLSDGKLNSNIVSFDGATQLSRGTTSGGVTDEGVYALDRGNGDIALLVQSGENDFTPGSITFAYQNNSDEVVNTLNVSYELVIRNDQEKNTSISLTYSTDGTTFLVPFGDRPVLTGEAPDNANRVSARNTSVGALNIAPGGTFFVRFTLEDAGGTGLYDEVAFDDITVTNLGFLPVALTSLTAAPTPKTVRVAWTTASESENDFFAVERSTDGTDFREIGRVRGQGTTTAAHDYLFVDEAPLAGTSYYRLRQQDFSGATTVSEFVVVDFRAASLTAFPNPAAGRLFVRGSDLGPAVILDVNGRVVQRVAQAGNGIDVSALSAGSYLLRVATANGTEVLRFVRE